MTKKFCISGYYGFDNFGDETILNVLVENIKAGVGQSQITIFSSNPLKTEKLYDVKSMTSSLIRLHLPGAGSAHKEPWLS